jgi:UDP-glucuronate 4-epimerase
MKILVTGAAGFIGFHLSKALLEKGYLVFGLDNLNDYYDVNLKLARLAILEKFENFTFLKKELASRDEIEVVFQTYPFDVVINLAAQAGVRYSLENPHVYIDSNITGFLNILEGCRHSKVKNLIFASSSSVYGANKKQPFEENHSTEHPLALYGATKKANELMAHSYANLYQLPCTGLRFFTVYGPWGRPDMALFKFTKNILEGKPIDVYNHGQMIRDFTYVDDIVSAIIKMVEKPAKPDPDWNGLSPASGSSYAPYQIYNIGNSNPTVLMEFIEAIEEATGKKAIINYMPMQDGDVPSTHADTTKLAYDFDFKPYTPVNEGIKKFVDWYKSYYKLGIMDKSAWFF